MNEPTMCMPVQQCRELLIELQQLRLRLTALEQVVASAVQDVEQDEQPSVETSR